MIGCLPLVSYLSYRVKYLDSLEIEKWEKLGSVKLNCGKNFSPTDFVKGWYETILSFISMRENL